MVAMCFLLSEKFVLFKGAHNATTVYQIFKVKSRVGIEKNNKTNQYVKGICLSRNFGHQEALLAGLYNTKADAYITIDADLQDDINVIKDMIEKYQEGYEAPELPDDIKVERVLLLTNNYSSETKEEDGGAVAYFREHSEAVKELAKLFDCQIWLTDNLYMDEDIKIVQE